MRFYSVLLLIIGLTACKSGHQLKKIEHFGTGILVVDKIDYAENIAIEKKVTKSCQLPEKLTTHIDKFAAKHYRQVLVNTDIATVPANTEVLRVKIVDITGIAKGIWSGEKYISIAGTLQKNGKNLGDFKGKCIPDNSVFGAYKGTCGIMQQCTKNLGEDIAKWLKHPARNAILGDY